MDPLSAPFTVSIPSVCESELRYTLKVVLKDWLGLSFEEKLAAPGRNLTIRRGRASLHIDISFFIQAGTSWLTPETLPTLPLKMLDIASLPTPLYGRLKDQVRKYPLSVPVLYGEPVIDLEITYGNEMSCHLDIFGSIFFMLSRYEEAVVTDRDEHDRSPATASIAYRAGFLERPIVNEYVELLWAMMQSLWPGLERKPREFRTLLSHDVDSPFAYFRLPAKTVIRKMGGDVLTRQAPSRAIQTLKTWRAANRGDVSRDPNNSFDFIMRESESRNLQSAFYFIPEHSAGAIDGRYTLDDHEIVELMREIDKRGHEIGLHTSFNTYRDSQQTAREAATLRSALEHHGIVQQPRGGRQHYLRWSTPQTFRNWESAGMQYDSTLGYADHVGFRCGTCWEFPVYDVVQRRPVALIERPLVAMEVSVAGHRYMNLGYGESAFRVFADIKETCRRYRGDFTLLWHNNNLTSPVTRELYAAVLDA